jgi:hypothetical protein
VTVRPPRLAAGRARALGVATRGTTAPNRLRRVDRWLIGTQAARLRAAADPLVVDLGYGSSPVTTVELRRRLVRAGLGVEVVGLERDAERVAAAAGAAGGGLSFAQGGFSFGGRRPVVARAMNVLRQYQEDEVWPAWSTMLARIRPGGLLIEGTCDEIGRLACWFGVERAPDPGGGGLAGAPIGAVTLTLAAHLPSLRGPAQLAERLPKALIARNVPGERIHALLAEFDAAWARAAPRAVFGPRQRWIAAVEDWAARGAPVIGTRRRWRLGEVTLAWDEAPIAAGPSAETLTQVRARWSASQGTGPAGARHSP